ncbi:hypothetical protein AFM16_06750 [Streptomyces antibioticus]|uniref:Lipoprotein n=1 Tax=Streptomyces antibioticus TaxID=1890 RepID=A0ABX3LR21_STRAT|nr:hypothetical protein AFM16_06750 [Streptomyces antibioticus]
MGAVWALTGDPDPDSAVSGTSASAGETETQTAEPEPTTFTLTGSFELTEGAVSDGSTGCKGTGGYDDIAEGSSVTVYDAAGTVIATGYLGDSTLASGSCTFDVAVENVPKGKDFYKVEVSHRGTVQLSGADAEAGRFGATLG